MSAQPTEGGKAMQDGPNTHHYRTFDKGTSFHVVTVDYVDGDRHTFHVPSEVVNQLDAPITADRERLLAVEAAARAARQEMSNRYDDLRWCNKPDLCHTKAEGAALALADFDDVLAAAGFDFRPAALARPAEEERG